MWRCPSPQYDRGEADLVPIRNAIEEDLAAALPLHSIVDRVCVGIRKVRKQVVALDSLHADGP